MQVIIPARSVERSLRYSRVHVDLVTALVEASWMTKGYSYVVPKCGGGFQIKLLDFRQFLYVM